MDKLLQYRNSPVGYPPIAFHSMGIASRCDAQGALAALAMTSLSWLLPESARREAVAVGTAPVLQRAHY